MSSRHAQSPPAEGTNSGTTGDAIAIVGIGCRYADARGPEEFWELVRSGRNTVRDVPQHRIELGYDIDHFYDPRPRIPGKVSSRKGGFLEHPELFDPAAFGIAPRDALTMEPQQRLMIEVTWDALEDAGIVPESLMGERVAVILGYMAEDYSRERTGVLGEAAVFRGHDVFTVGGMSHAVLSGRIAFLLGVTGPSLTLDTACSSSLIATHLACQSLLRGESKMAIAGGANVFLSPEGNIALSRSGMLSMSGACKAFDASADGFVRAEGAGVVVLRPLADALREGNPIYAVIRGSGISTDGRDGGHMMAPGRHGQAQAMRDAYARAGVSPADVQYVETHGTGTMIGDPVEIAALAEVMGPGRSPDRPLRVASVKGNLGHTESASGVAGLIKAALAIRHRELPAQLHFETPNPAIPWDEIPIRVQSESTPWPTPGPALVGVNSFGISGTNAHVVLESPPEAPFGGEAATSGSAPSGPTLVVLTGHDVDALHENVVNLRARLDDASAPAFGDLAYTLARRRSHRAHRLGVVAESRRELAVELDAYLDGRASGSVRTGTAPAGRTPKLVMVFPGQGSQWSGMGRSLLETHPAFAASIDRIDSAYREHVDWSLRALLDGRAGIDWTARLDLVQPLLVAMEIALAELWSHFGVRPDRVVGQSMGEIAAAHVAGALTLADAARLACHRGRIVARASGEGAMGVVSLPREAVETELASREGRVEIAGSNSPSTTIVSGDRDAVRAVVDAFDARGVFARTLDVDFASHCFHMDPLLDGFRSEIAGVRPEALRVPFESTVDDAEKSGDELDAEYWVRNLREPVAFDRGLARSIEAGGEIFLEVSPHAALDRPIAEIASSLGSAYVHVPTLRREQDEAHAVATSLAELFVRGVPVDFDALLPSGRVVRTPLYAYQRRRFWFSDRNRTHQFRPVHPLLGACSQSSIDPRLHSWDFVLDADSAGFIADHSIAGRPGAPAGVHPELALAAAAAVWPDAPVAIHDTELMHPLRLPEDGRVTVQVVLRVDADRTGELRVASRDTSAAPWTLHSICRLRPAQSPARTSGSGGLDRSGMRSVPVETHFETLERCGVRLGARCRTLRELEAAGEDRVGRRVLVGRLMLPRSVESEWFAYHAHPAILEESFQLVGAACEHPAAVRVTTIGRIHFERPLGSDAWCRVIFDEDGQGAEHSRHGGAADLEFFDREGRAIGWIDGLRVETIPERRDASEPDAEGRYSLGWAAVDPLSIVAGEREVERWIVVSETEEHASVLSAELRKQGGTTLYCKTVLDLPSLAARLRREADTPWGIVLMAWGDPAGDGSATFGGSSGASLSPWGEAIGEYAADAREVWIATRGWHEIDAEDDGSRRVRRQLSRTIDSLASRIGLPRCRLFDASLQLEHAEHVVLASLLGFGGPEWAFATRRNELRTPRLRPLATVSPRSRTVPTTTAGERNFRAVHAAREGFDCVALEEAPEPEGRSDSVIVDVRYAALSQLDVLTGLGLARPGRRGGTRSLAIDFSGIVREVGDVRSDLRVGDEVMGVWAGALARRIAVPTGFVVRKPAGLGLDEAASLPFPFLVARYALQVVARLRAGERILLLSAGGGVGLALAQIASAIGAEVCATAGSPERRAQLRALGVHLLEPDGAFEARASTVPSADFDVIVGARSGTAMHSMLDRLAPGGRYLDLCPRDRFERPELGAFRLSPNRVYAAIDIEEVMCDEPSLVSALLEQTAEDVTRERARPIPSTWFELADAGRAIRFMAQNRHTGRVGVALSNPDEAVIHAAKGEALAWAGRGAIVVSGGDVERRLSLVDEIRKRGGDDVFESASVEPEALADELSSSGRRWGGWIHLTNGRGGSDDRETAPLVDAACGFRALVSRRERPDASSPTDRAWSARLVIDRSRFVGSGDEGGAMHLSVGDVTSIEALTDALERGITDPVGASQIVLLDEDELAERSNTLGGSLLEGLSQASRRRETTQWLRSELLSLAPSERRESIERFVCDSLAGLLGLSESGRQSLEIASRLDALGLDSLKTMEFFVGLGRDLELDIAADWFESGPTLADIAAVLLERLESKAAARSNH